MGKQSKVKCFLCHRRKYPKELELNDKEQDCFRFATPAEHRLLLAHSRQFFLQDKPYMTSNSRICRPHYLLLLVCKVVDPNGHDKKLEWLKEPLWMTRFSDVIKITNHFKDETEKWNYLFPTKKSRSLGEASPSPKNKTTEKDSTVSAIETNNVATTTSGADLNNDREQVPLNRRLVFPLKRLVMNPPSDVKSKHEKPAASSYSIDDPDDEFVRACWVLASEHPEYVRRAICDDKIIKYARANLATTANKKPDKLFGELVTSNFRLLLDSREVVSQAIGIWRKEVQEQVEKIPRLV